MAFSKHFHRMYYGPRLGKEGEVELGLGQPSQVVSKLTLLSYEAAQADFTSINHADPNVTAELSMAPPYLWICCVPLGGHPERESKPSLEAICQEAKKY